MYYRSGGKQDVKSIGYYVWSCSEDRRFKEGKRRKIYKKGGIGGLFNKVDNNRSKMDKCIKYGKYKSRLGEYRI